MSVRLPRLVRLVLTAAVAAGLALGVLHKGTPRGTSTKPKTHAPAVKEWERLESCVLAPNRWNDGDSFHVRHGEQDYLFRLYFVDTPEAEESLPERTVTQASYFGISPAEALIVGQRASAFTKAELGKRPFTIITRWRDALGRSKQQRFYAFVETGGRDLNELLVAQGLARIYGTRVPLPDGRDSRTYLAALGQLELAAKREKRGAWGVANRRGASWILPRLENDALGIFNPALKDP